MSERPGGAWLLAPEVARHIFVSAHFDDAVFSCGGTIATLAQAGRHPILAVVFAAAPEAGASLSPFAADHNALWGIAGDATASNAGRQREELVAASLLGAEVIPLPFTDAIYRGDRYQANAQLFGSLDPAESHLPAAVAGALRAALGPLDHARLYIPLAVGRHVDHQIAYLAGRTLAHAGLDVWCYEDVPYSVHPAATDSRLADLGDELGDVETVPVDAVWQTRLDAVMAYRSQLPSAFGYVGVEPTRPAITVALDRVAGGATARHERFRPIVPTP